ncbi:MAG: hypothetical protein KGV46_01940 [Pasteurella sp.]|nr:hypothetical protein [Pasteurella sp.]
MRPLRTFINSEHIFDNEDNITCLLQEYKLLDGNTELKHYKFIDSKSELLIQLSDVFVGIMGKYIEFLNAAEMYELNDFIKNLDVQQRRNLKLLLALEQKSHNHNPAMLHHVCPLSVFRKAEYLCECLA